MVHIFPPVNGPDSWPPFRETWLTLGVNQRANPLRSLGTELKRILAMPVRVGIVSVRDRSP